MPHKPSNRQIKANNNENSENPTLYPPCRCDNVLGSPKQIKLLAVQNMKDKAIFHNGKFENVIESQLFKFKELLGAKLNRSNRRTSLIQGTHRGVY